VYNSEATKQKQKTRSTKLKKKIIFVRENIEYNESSRQPSYIRLNDGTALPNATIGEKMEVLWLEGRYWSEGVEPRLFKNVKLCFI